ncbi:MAG: LacI family DNA-binding transcriptional regulator [Acidobacteria bacterium]|nr:LacI family DNA-binding transcriptional regulator [Acidobacteriota bacterium]
MPTTLADIAAELGVSKMTVSRTINNHPAIHPNTRERVLTVARHMNYRPNQHARALSTNRAHLLGLVVPDLMHSYYAEIAKAIEAEARAAGYEVLICNTEEDAASELREVEALLHRTDGLIIASAVAPNQPGAYRRLLREGSKLVLIDRSIEGLKCPQVTTDNVAAGALVTEHFIKLGHRRIGHLRGTNVSVAHDRWEGYRQALTQHGLAYDETLVRACGFFESGGYSAMRDWLKDGNHPTAIFAANDPAAIGAMRALAEAKLNVPRDIAVAGMGAIHYGDLLSVPLTTVDWDKTELGRQAAKLLIGLIETKEQKRDADRRVIVPPQLVIRQSCGAKAT